MASYQLKITLLGIKPEIWRRFIVPSNITLAKLHEVIQNVMGWTDSHMHHFFDGKNYYMPKMCCEDGELPEETHTLEKNALKKGANSINCTTSAIPGSMKSLLKTLIFRVPIGRIRSVALMVRERVRRTIAAAYTGITISARR